MMRIPRFYIDQTLQVGNEVELPTALHRHAIQVLRLREKDQLILFNGIGGEYLAVLIRAKKRSSCVTLIAFDAVNRESPLKTTLALAVIKADKMDFALQKAVEMGVNHIQPLYTKRSVVKLKVNRLDKKIAHWEGVITAACEQSGRTARPQLVAPLVLASWLQRASDSLRLALLPHHSTQFNDLNPPDNQKVTLIVGPEGGFADEEVTLLLASGVKGVQCGARILRAETAVIAGMALCQQQWGDL